MNQIAQSANDRQHGGTHYKRSSYNHWDWVHDCKLGYHAGNASKYAFRYRDKGKPEEDLDKAIHYIDKCQELGLTGSVAVHRHTAFWQFVLANDVKIQDAPALWFIMEGQWNEARHALQAMRSGLSESVGE